MLGLWRSHADCQNHVVRALAPCAAFDPRLVLEYEDVISILDGAKIE
jgi:hypothetical protein